MKRPSLVTVAALTSIALAVAGCLPNGPPTSTQDTGAATATQKKKPPPVASVRAPAAGDPLLTEPFVDDFERGSLGPDWRAIGFSAWKIENGRLCGKGARNKGVWLTKRLPINARIEIDAVSTSPDGDLKLELWGDGASGATSTSYTNATSYLAILGGWKNTLHVLARLDEHGSDRKELKISAALDDPRARPVSPGQVYRLKVERLDGRTVTFSVDDTRLHAFEDESPLAGAGHDHFGLNDWEVPVCFDNLRITPL